MSWIDEISITAFVAQVRQEPDPGHRMYLTLEWIEARLNDAVDEGGEDYKDAVLDSIGMIDVYRGVLGATVPSR
jgi:hypothetical protein